MVNPRTGLRPTTHNRLKDFDHKKFWPVKRLLFGSTALPGLPPTLGRTPICINDQQESNFCTGFAISEAIGNQVGIPMAPEAQVALEGKIAGQPIYGGTDPKTAMESGLVGAMAKSICPYTFANNGWTSPAQWQNYNNFLVSFLYPRASYYSVTQGGDALDVFDSIKLALWDSKDDAINNGFPPVICMGYWYQSWNGITSNGIVPELQAGESPITRHCYLFIDWKNINGVEYLVAQLSQGIENGDKGLYYFSRANVNRSWQNIVPSGLALYIYRSKNPSFWSAAVFNILKVLNLI